jgi:CheY-like chemotaxis protein
MKNMPKEIKKVYIVDDDEFIRDMYSKKFGMEGFEVACAINGEEGLKLIRKQKPDIVILDIQMPVKNGLEVLAEMKNDKLISAIPVVILSNNNDENTYARVGAIDTPYYVIKSLSTPQKIVDIVREVLHC